MVYKKIPLPCFDLGGCEVLQWCDRNHNAAQGCCCVYVQ